MNGVNLKEVHVEKKFHTVHVQVPIALVIPLKSAAILAGKRHLAQLMLDLLIEWYERTHKPSKTPSGKLLEPRG